jgi:hypothetical protein
VAEVNLGVESWKALRDQWHKVTVNGTKGAVQPRL